MSFRPHYTLTPRIQELVIEIEVFRKSIGKLPILPSWLKELQKEALADEAHHNTAIEGNLLTIQETKEVLFEDRMIPNKEPDVKEIHNLKNAREFVLQLSRLDENHIKQIQKMVCEGRGDVLIRDYRRKNVAVVDKVSSKAIYRAPDYEKVSVLMNELLEWYHSNNAIRSHSCITAVILHYQFVAIHPFEDGNGRTGRLLEMYQLVQTGYDFKNLYSPSKRYNENRTVYYHALQSVEKNRGDLTQWIEFALRGMVNELRSVEKKAELEYRKVIYTQLDDEFKLNDRQNWMLQQLAKSGKVSFSDYKKQFADKADRTLRKDIENLLKDKLIIEDGTKQKRLFRPNLYWDENRHYER